MAQKYPHTAITAPSHHKLRFHSDRRFMFVLVQGRSVHPGWESIFAGRASAVESRANPERDPAVTLLITAVRLPHSTQQSKKRRISPKNNSRESVGGPLRSLIVAFEACQLGQNRPLRGWGGL